MKIEDLHLEERVLLAIRRAGCTTMEELYQRISDDPEGLRRDIGFATFDKIEELLLHAFNREDTLSIESPHFISMRTDLDAMLQKTVNSMIRRESDEASVTLKISLRLSHTADRLARSVIRPEITHKITSAITVKDNTDGRLQGEYELVYDSITERYVMRELPPEDGQLPLLTGTEG